MMPPIKCVHGLEKVEDCGGLNGTRIVGFLTCIIVSQDGQTLAVYDIHIINHNKSLEHLTVSKNKCIFLFCVFKIRAATHNYLHY